ncbi:helix-turn-helix domain-containing protein [Ruminococcaceae bacterium OttesenSCG-928-O06]|nr:helix-turn-helix domain-containing protein [Ruminococcaceae bacterium OttesenSCG-928-O06]
MAELGGRLRSLREGAKLLQKDIAAKIGTTQASINRYESSSGTPPTDTLLWYADYFDVSLDYIYGRTDDPRGKLYDYKPEVLREISEKNEEIRQFVAMCFDPNSSINPRLKEMLTKMLTEGQK